MSGVCCGGGGGGEEWAIKRSAKVAIPVPFPLHNRGCLHTLYLSTVHKQIVFIGYKIEIKAPPPTQTVSRD